MKHRRDSTKQSRLLAPAACGDLCPNRPFVQEGGGNPVVGLRKEEDFSGGEWGRFSNRSTLADSAGAGR
jgi:hypothetical protein